MFSLFHINEFPLIYSIRYPLPPCPGCSPDVLCSRYKVRPDDHVEAVRWLVKRPLIDPGMADPAVPVRIEAVPGFAGVWSGDRQSLWRPAKPQATGKAAGDRVSRIFRAGWQAGGALRRKMLYVICYLLYVSCFGLRCLRGVKQKIDTSGDNI